MAAKEQEALDAKKKAKEDQAAALAKPATTGAMPANGRDPSPPVENGAVAASPEVRFPGSPHADNATAMWRLRSPPSSAANLNWWLDAGCHNCTAPARQSEPKPDASLTTWATLCGIVAHLRNKAKRTRRVLFKIGTQPSIAHAVAHSDSVCWFVCLFFALLVAELVSRLFDSCQTAC